MVKSERPRETAPLLCTLGPPPISQCVQPRDRSSRNTPPHDVAPGLFPKAQLCSCIADASCESQPALRPVLCTQRLFAVEMQCVGVKAFRGKVPEKSETSPLHAANRPFSLTETTNTRSNR